MTRLSRWLANRSLRAQGLGVLSISFIPLVLTTATLISSRGSGTSDARLVVVAGIGTVLGMVGGIVAMMLFTASVSSRLRTLHEASDYFVRDSATFMPPEGSDEVALLGRKLQKTALLLKVRNEAVRRVHETFNRFFMLSLDLFCVAGFDGYFKRFNPAWPETLGWSEEELLTQPFIDFVHPDDREATARQAENLAQGVIIVSFENRYRCRDGTFRWLEWKAVPLVAEGLIHAVARDVTADKEAQARDRDLTGELERRNAQLIALNREQQAFSYSVSHDLRAPLRSIDGFSQILLEDYMDKLDVEGQDALHRVRAAAKGMGELIDALLELSRLSRVELRAERVDLSALAEAIAAECRHSHPDRHVEFTIVPGLIVQGDPRLLRAALGNLIGNSWKYTQPRPTARIEFGCSRKDGETIYFVRDNGVGFDMTYVDKLFGAFQRLHRQTEFGGTGIGLATVQRIIQRHGGRVWAEGIVNRGATFYFTLLGGPRRDATALHEAEVPLGVS